jgi:hypothetical protein
MVATILKSNLEEKRLKRALQLRGRLSTVDLLVEVTCFVKKVNNIFNIDGGDLN